MKKLIFVLIFVLSSVQAQSLNDLFKNGEKVVPHQMVVAQENSKPINQQSTEKVLSFREAVQGRASQEIIKNNVTTEPLNPPVHIPMSNFKALKTQSIENLSSALSWYDNLLEVQQHDKAHYFSEHGWSLFKRNIWPMYHKNLGSQIKMIKATPMGNGFWMSTNPTLMTLSVPMVLDIDYQSGVRKISYNVIAVIKKNQEAWQIDGIEFQSVL